VKISQGNELRFITHRTELRLKLSDVGTVEFFLQVERGRTIVGHKSRDDHKNNHHVTKHDDREVDESNRAGRLGVKSDCGDNGKHNEQRQDHTLSELE
jgi:hypothetical protein